MTTAPPTRAWRSLEIASNPNALADWEQLYAEIGTTPLLHPDFMRASLNAFARPTTKFVSCTEGDKLIACGIIEAVGPLRLTTFQPSQAPLGAWLQRGNTSLLALLRSLVATQPPWIVSFSITQQDPYLLACPPQSPALRVADYIDTARISIATSWDDYWKARGANLRHNIKRAKSKLASAGSTFALRVLTDTGDMSEAVRVYGEIESRSWKSLQGTAVSFDNRQGGFYLQLLESFARRGKARCYQLVIGDRVAATDLCILGGEEIVILKTTYDENFRDLSPAFLMRELAFRELFAERWCKRIEFYGRVMDWHRRWTDEVRRMYHGTYFRYPGTLRAWKTIKRLRGRLRQQEAAEASQQSHMN